MLVLNTIVNNLTQVRDAKLKINLLAPSGHVCPKLEVFSLNYISGNPQLKYIDNVFIRRGLP